MKIVHASAAFLLVAWSTASLVRAEEMGMGGKDPQKMEQMQQERESKRLERMTKKLNLSADQQTSVKAALDDQRTKMADLMKQMKAIHEDTETKINAVLTADQKTKYAAMQEEAKEKRQDHWKKNHAGKD